MKCSRLLIRVTSVWYHSPIKTVFSGVAINSDGENLLTNKYFVVHAPSELVPLEPKKAQHWEITGPRSERSVVKNSCVMTEVNVNASKLRVVMPDSENAFTLFIQNESSFAQIGARTAHKLWVHFRSEIYEILKRKDTLRLQSVLSPKATQSLLQGWEKFENLRHIAWFDKHEIPSGIAMNLIKYHGEDALDKFNEDPYRLITFGLSFEQADHIATAHFNVQNNDERRLSAALHCALNARMCYGHTVSNDIDLRPHLTNYIDSELVSDALKLGSKTAIFTKDVHGYYHPAGLFIMEQVVAKRLVKLSLKSIWSHHYDEALAKALANMPFPLMEKQQDAVINSLSHGASIISGGAGTGKTTVLRVILRAYMFLGIDIKPMALSGKAAKRITESTGFVAQTIAGFLKNPNVKEDKNTIIVIDEASMVDLPTMFKIITSVPENVRILLVGDPDQLSPIGAGLVLQDVVHLLPTVVLDIVKRQDESTGIPEFTNVIKNKQIPQLDTGFSNINFHSCMTKEINDVVVKLLKQDPENTQVICAQYKGIGGVDSINMQCQSVCNESGRLLDFSLEYGERFLNIKENDPVIFTENNWDRDIQNGTMGRLISVHQVDDAIGVVNLDDGRTIPLTFDLIDSIKPAYAISLHKAQGSQFKRIIIPLTNSQMIDNAWIYTALTRAEVTIELVGDWSNFFGAVNRNSSSSVRNTYLKELVKNEITLMNQL